MTFHLTMSSVSVITRTDFILSLPFSTVLRKRFVLCIKSSFPWSLLFSHKIRTNSDFLKSSYVSLCPCFSCPLGSSKVVPSEDGKGFQQLDPLIFLIMNPW